LQYIYIDEYFSLLVGGNTVHVSESNNKVYITEKEWEAIPGAYKGIYEDYDGNHPDWVGRKVAFLPGYGTMLFIEGVTFEIDNSNVLS